MFYFIFILQGFTKPSISIFQYKSQRSPHKKKIIATHGTPASKTEKNYQHHGGSDNAGDWCFLRSGHPVDRPGKNRLFARKYPNTSEQGQWCNNTGHPLFHALNSQFAVCYPPYHLFMVQGGGYCGTRYGGRWDQQTVLRIFTMPVSFNEMTFSTSPEFNSDVPNGQAADCVWFQEGGMGREREEGKKSVGMFAKFK